MSETRTTINTFNEKLANTAGSINNTLKQLLSEQTCVETNLKKALDYTLLAPGKRIRGALVHYTCELVSEKPNQNAQIAAAAIEMVHTYSLIHDDLPAMDDDDLRRGLPTCHKAFDEATAILAGDALLTLAFGVLAEKIDDQSIAINLVRYLARAAGAAGMVAGQMADLKAENDQPTEQLVSYIHTNKTAKIFRCAAEFGALCGRAKKSELEILGEYGLKIGRAFQIADDILDLNSSTKHLGKTTGKDARAGKATYPAVLGIEKSRQLEQNLAKQATGLLAPFGRKADTLIQLANALLERTR
jgi:geranylgeranyl diphosphate synthase type II